MLSSFAGSVAAQPVMICAAWCTGVLLSCAGSVAQPVMICAAWCTGVLLSLPDGMEQLRDGISSLCETLWCREFAARDELVPQMLAYLLQRCLNPSSSVIVAVH